MQREKGRERHQSEIEIEKEGGRGRDREREKKRERERERKREWDSRLIPILQLLFPILMSSCFTSLRNSLKNSPAMFAMTSSEQHLEMVKSYYDLLLFLSSFISLIYWTLNSLYHCLLFVQYFLRHCSMFAVSLHSNHSGHDEFLKIDL